MSQNSKEIYNQNEQVVILNVGGMPFSTPFGTLKPSPYFVQLFSNKNSFKTKNEAIFIDRDGDLFSHVLEYLRSYEINFTGNLEELKNEAEFYQLKIMVQMIEIMLQKRHSGRKKVYKLVSLEELENISCLTGEKETSTSIVLSEKYEFISVVKFNELSWIYDPNYYNGYNENKAVIKKGKEIKKILVAKIFGLDNT